MRTAGLKRRRDVISLEGDGAPREAGPQAKDYFLLVGGLRVLCERADLNSIPPGVTFATTGVAPDLVELCFSRPRSRALGWEGFPLLVALTWTFHFVPVLKVALISAAPLLPGLTSTFAPLDLKLRATFCSLSVPYLY